MPFIPIAEKERKELEKLPPQLSKVILKKKKAPPPPPPPKKEKVEEKKPEPKEEKPKEKPKPKPEKPKPKPDPKKVEKAREKAKQSGLLKHTAALKELRQSLDLGTLSKGSKVNQGGKEATKVERAVIASSATAGSGGVSAAGISRGTAGSGLQGQAVSELNDEAALADMAAEADRNARAGKKGKRSDEEIRRVFDANKGPMFTIYNKALRKNPLLEGKVKFEFTIEPDGSVSACKVVSSELDDKKLERRLAARIRLFDFGAKNVDRGTYQLWYEFTQG
jgi:outer membrane biosynthesis protein TonB